ncbi:MAG: hypothetical protein R2909_15965 [Gemmatimonadales bacterium]
MQAGSNALSLPDRTRDLINVVTVLAILLQAGIWATAALQFRVGAPEEAPDGGYRAAAT